MSLISRIILTSLIPISLQAAVTRPPQFVVMSFDGSKSIERWQATKEFARDNNLKFTYFISGVYYISNANRTEYRGPGRAAGRSDIGFGENSTDIKTRISETLGAYNEGNEIGSHANGHFDGAAWSQEQWRSEFDQFTRFLTQAFMLNNIVDAALESPWVQAIARSIKGFRAPLLANNQAMYDVMNQDGMTYDTSTISRGALWPTKRPNSSVWQMPLQSLPIVGTAKRTITMDYNFYVAQSGAQPNPANARLYQTQMYDSYLAHFNRAYEGNRAPIIIGHHFSNWNGSAYWNALKAFAQEVCAKPEVRCVTHSELVSFLNENQNSLAGFEAGDFPRLPRSSSNAIQSLYESAQLEPATYDLEMSLRQQRQYISVDVTGAQRALVQRGQLKWTIDGAEITALRNQYTIDLATVSARPGQKLRAALYRDNLEIQSVTHELTRAMNLSNQSLEARAAMGDMAEAHNDDR